MEFILGCNYWASNAGTDMWRKFDAAAVEKDLQALSSNGVSHMRVFPNWRDFQPVMPVYAAKTKVHYFLLEGDRKPENPYYLDEAVMDHFALFLTLCEKYNIKLIIGLITGWMSGRTFIPSALFGKNVLTDPLALHFEQLFIKGFVSRFKDSPAILAWDLGNECNGMNEVDRWQAVAWAGIISNAIKAEDASRPVVSGMHGLQVYNTGSWLIQDQALHTDILTTHPYAFWCQHTKIDRYMALRTTMHPTAQTKLYAEIGGKPCMAEEIGSMGPSINCNENAGTFLRLNLYSLWANGSIGAMWWCNFDQDMLPYAPYVDNMGTETELGMMDKNYKPRPVLTEIKHFADFLSSLDFDLPPAHTDAVCILSRDQDQWGVAYMTYILARQTGLNLRFAMADEPLPDAPLYLLPSTKGWSVMETGYWHALQKKVEAGADLYVSMDDCGLQHLEKVSGLKVIDSYQYRETDSVTVNGQKISILRDRKYIMQNVNAQVLACDEAGDPAIAVNRLGKGTVYFLNFPMEAGLIYRHNAFPGPESAVYQTLFADHIRKLPVRCADPYLAVTCHEQDDEMYVVICNHAEDDRDTGITLPEGWILDKVIRGDISRIRAFDACVIKLKKK